MKIEIEFNQVWGLGIAFEDNRYHYDRSVDFAIALLFFSIVFRFKKNQPN